MFGEKAPFATRPATYAALRDSKTLMIESDEHDVFGDGSVVLKARRAIQPAIRSSI